MVHISLIALALNASPARAELADTAYRAYESVVKSAGEVSYDLATLFDAKMKCPARQPEAETKAIAQLFAEKPGEPGQDPLGAVKGALAKANIPGVQCDLYSVGAIVGAEANGPRWRDIEDRLKVLGEIDAKWAVEHRKMREKLPKDQPATAEEARRRLAEKNDLLAPLIELESARNFIISSIPFGDSPRVKRVLFNSILRFNQDGALQAPNNHARTLKLLRDAYSGLKGDLGSELVRNKSAAINRGEGLNVNDLNKLVQDPFLISQLAKDDPAAQKGLEPILCSLNRSYGQGQDIFDKSVAALSVVTLPVTGGLGFLANSSKFAVWASRSKGLLSSRSLGAVSHAAARLSLAANSAGFTQMTAKCLQEHPSRISKADAPEQCAADQVYTAEAEFHDCLFAVAFPAVAGAASRLKKIGTLPAGPATSLEKAEVAAIKANHRGGKTDTYEVRLVDGRRGIFKPCDNGPDSSCTSEVAASLIDERLKLGLVPETVIKEIKIGDQKVRGSLQLFEEGVPGSQVLQPPPFRDYLARRGRLPQHKDDMDSISFFDVLIDNVDRHAGNTLVQRNGRTVAIDHSQSLRDVPALADDVAYLRRTDPGAYIKQKFDNANWFGAINRFVGTERGQQAMAELRRALGDRQFMLSLENQIGKFEAGLFRARAEFLLQRYH